MGPVVSKLAVIKPHLCAARDEGRNALYIAIKDIGWLSNYRFPKVSSLLGSVHLAITSINTPNKTHNIVPAECNFMIDIRVNELYSFEEVIATIKDNISSEIQPRSIRLKSSYINDQHPLVVAGKKLALPTYGSPTCSDIALMNFPSLKIGPGDSARSHIANEFIYIYEIKEAIDIYIQLLKKFARQLNHPENKSE